MAGSSLENNVAGILNGERIANICFVVANGLLSICAYVVDMVSTISDHLAICIHARNKEISAKVLSTLLGFEDEYDVVFLETIKALSIGIEPLLFGTVITLDINSII